MSKRKEFFRLNYSGVVPIRNFSARFHLKDFVFNNKQFTELHIIGDFTSIQLSLRNHKDITINPIGTAVMWDRRPSGWLNRINSDDSLKKAIMDLKESFQAVKIPEWLGNLQEEIIGSIKV